MKDIFFHAVILSLLFLIIISSCENPSTNDDDSTITPESQNPLNHKEYIREEVSGHTTFRYGLHFTATDIDEGSLFYTVTEYNNGVIVSGDIHSGNFEIIDAQNVLIDTETPFRSVTFPYDSEPDGNLDTTISIIGVDSITYSYDLYP